jgi:hypothetical protein
MARELSPDWPETARVDAMSRPGGTATGAEMPFPESPSGKMCLI